MNRVDGKTNAADIARAVCAEALSAGWWYYGKTTPEPRRDIPRPAGEGRAPLW